MAVIQFSCLKLVRQGRHTLVLTGISIPLYLPPYKTFQTLVKLQFSKRLCFAILWFMSLEIGDVSSVDALNAINGVFCVVVACVHCGVNIAECEPVPCTQELIN